MHLDISHRHPKIEDLTNIMVKLAILTKIPSKGTEPIDVVIKNGYKHMESEPLPGIRQAPPSWGYPFHGSNTPGYRYTRYNP